MDKVYALPQHVLVSMASEIDGKEKKQGKRN